MTVTPELLLVGGRDRARRPFRARGLLAALLCGLASTPCVATAQPSAPTPAPRPAPASVPAAVSAGARTTGPVSAPSGPPSSSGPTSTQGIQRHRVTGMVLSVDAPRRTFLVSHDAIEGVMDAMTMAFEASEPGELAGLTPGMAVTFTLVMAKGGARAEAITVVPDDSVELDPMVARRLALLEALTGTPRPAPLAVGDVVPDVTLTDQTGAVVSLSALRGQVVVMNFVYTSCALTQFCFRVTNHFASVARRFEERLGRDLTMVTVTFDPARDTVDVLRSYASQWHADARTWKFLTGSVDDIRRVCDMFGVTFFPDEGLMNHSLRTVVIDRTGTLAGKIEGNEYTATQLGDLVAGVLTPPR